jgi:hypothetical protein
MTQYHAEANENTPGAVPGVFLLASAWYWVMASPL